MIIIISLSSSLSFHLETQFEEKEMQLEAFMQLRDTKDLESREDWLVSAEIMMSESIGFMLDAA